MTLKHYASVAALIVYAIGNTIFVRSLTGPGSGFDGIHPH